MSSEAFEAWWKRYQKTGDISPVKLGYTREVLRGLFGEPDRIGGVSSRHTKGTIWKYGELEFHFGPKKTDALFLIWSDTPDGVVKICIPENAKVEN